MKRISIPLLLALFTSGCVSISKLPQHVTDVDFNLKREGKTGWGSYERNLFFEDVERQDIGRAAEASLVRNGFTIKRRAPDTSFVIGRHGMTARDWNVVAGVYCIALRDGVAAKILVETSRDVSLIPPFGDTTSKDWLGLIAADMRRRLKARK